MNRVLALLVGAALALGACSTSTTTAGPNATTVASVTSDPTQAAQATEGPSPTPADVSQAFQTQIIGATKGQMTLTGSLELGAQLGDVSGSLTYVGGDSDQTTTITVAGVASKTSNVHVGGVAYSRNGDGPWFQDLVAPKAGTDLETLLKGMKALVDKGIEAHDGVQAHRIELAAGTVIPAAAFGLTDKAIVNPVVELAFYAADDGKPLAIVVTITWTQTLNGTATPVKMALDLRYTQIGGTLTVRVPDHVWQRFSSQRFHYKIAFPDDWDVSTSVKTADYFDSPVDSFVAVGRTKLSGVSLNTFTKALISYEKSHYHFTFNSNVSFSLAGVKARLLTFHATSNGKKVVLYEVVALKGGYVYDVAWSSPKGNEAADLQLLKQILATLTYA